MKNIPQSLLNKLQKRFQAAATDANPAIRIISTQATVNTLLTEPIHCDIPAEFGDVTLRQLQGEKMPSLAYAICIDDGIAKIYKRDFPANLDKPWDYLWTLGAAKDVAIEFDGVWVLETEKRWHVLETSEYPYIFWVDGSDNLYVQYWQDDTTRTQLASSVSQISSCRGWQSSDIPEQDQGLVIAYLKNGVIFYRAYCTQQAGDVIWEEERSIPQYSNISALSVFRTNDFRLGFVFEITSSMYWLLTKRTYAGQSVRAESFYSVVCDAVLSYIFINWIDSNEENESLACLNDLEEGGVIYFPVAADDLQVINLEREGTNTFIASFNYPLIAKRPLTPELFTMTPPYTIAGISIIESSKLQFISNENINKTVPITITYIGNWPGNLRFVVLPTAKRIVPALTMVFPNIPNDGYDDAPIMIAALVVGTFQYKAIYYLLRYGSMGTINASLANITFAATMVGTVPV